MKQLSLLVLSLLASLVAVGAEAYDATLGLFTPATLVAYSIPGVALCQVSEVVSGTWNAGGFAFYSGTQAWNCPNGTLPQKAPSMVINASKEPSALINPAYLQACFISVTATTADVTGDLLASQALQAAINCGFNPVLVKSTTVPPPADCPPAETAKGSVNGGAQLDWSEFNVTKGGAAIGSVSVQILKNNPSITVEYWRLKSAYVEPTRASIDNYQVAKNPQGMQTDPPARVVKGDKGVIVVFRR